MEGSMRKVTDVPKYTQTELCEAVGLDMTTANNWVQRDIIHPGTFEGRDITRVRLFSELEVYRAKFLFELVDSLGVAPSKAAEVSRSQASEWVQAARAQDTNEVFVLLSARQTKGWRSGLLFRELNSPTLSLLAK